MLVLILDLPEELLRKITLSVCREHVIYSGEGRRGVECNGSDRIENIMYGTNYSNLVSCSYFANRLLIRFFTMGQKAPKMDTYHYVKDAMMISFDTWDMHSKRENILRNV